MARIDNLTNFLTDIADTIRSKTGSTATLTASNFDGEIDGINYVVPSDARIGFVQSTATSINLKNLDTSNLIDMQQVFNHCQNLTDLDLENFSTASATNMKMMFNSCSSLTDLDLINFDTSSVINAQAMFSGCSSLTSLDLSMFDTSSMTNMSAMFQNDTSLETITFGEDWTLSSATNLNYIFDGCTKLDNNTLNEILYLCTTAPADYNTKTLAHLGIDSTFDNFANIPNLSNYQAFLDAGWTIS